MTMNFEHILFSIEAGVALLSLNRPDQLNSFNTQMHGEVKEALKQVRQNPDVRVLLLTGEGRGFCAGQDLSDRNVAPGSAVPDLGESIEKFYNPLIRQLRDLPLPVICAVNGVAAGAGANIPLACDLVLAARSASFIQAFCKIGLIPDSGGTWTLPRLVGMARAKALALLGNRLSAEQAEQWGLIYRVRGRRRTARRSPDPRPPPGHATDLRPGADQTQPERQPEQHLRRTAGAGERPATPGRAQRGLP